MKQKKNASFKHYIVRHTHEALQSIVYQTAYIDSHLIQII